VHQALRGQIHGEIGPEGQVLALVKSEPDGGHLEIDLEPRGLPIPPTRRRDHAWLCDNAEQSLDASNPSVVQTDDRLEHHVEAGLLQHAPDAPDLSPPEHQLGLIVFELAGKFLHDVLSNLTGERSLANGALVNPSRMRSAVAP